MKLVAIGLKVSLGLASCKLALIGDCGPAPFTTLRGISEVGLSKLDAKTRRDTVAAGLKALSALEFYPEQADALLYYAKTEVSVRSSNKIILWLLKLMK